MHPTGLRSRTKPWQVMANPLDLGTRCCCDTSHRGTAKCKRTSLVGHNWRKHCPKADIGYGVHQLHHNPLGCVVPNKVVAQRCCCVDPLEYPGRELPEPLCQYVDEEGLNWRGHS